MRTEEKTEKKEQAAKGHGKIKLLFFVISTFVFFRKLVFQKTRHLTFL
jgi:hypothetical protein